MYSRIALIPIVIAAIITLVKNGGVDEIKSFRPSPMIINGIIVNTLLGIMFAELYWIVDSRNNHEDFGFESPLDAYYFSVVTASSVGYGDFLAKSSLAKGLVMTQISTTFFLVLPAVIEALKPGN